MKHYFLKRQMEEEDFIESYFKKRKSISIKNLKELFDTLANNVYPELSVTAKKCLYKEDNVDCGTDFARLLLRNLNYHKQETIF